MERRKQGPDDAKEMSDAELVESSFGGRLATRARNDAVGTETTHDARDAAQEFGSGAEIC